jgi:hypothetical protein
MYQLYFGVEGLPASYLANLPSTQEEDGDDPAKKDDDPKDDSKSGSDELEDVDEDEGEIEKESIQDGSSGSFVIPDTPTNKIAGAKTCGDKFCYSGWSKGNKFQPLVALNAIDSDDEMEAPLEDVEMTMFQPQGINNTEETGLSHQSSNTEALKITSPARTTITQAAADVTQQKQTEVPPEDTANPTPAQAAQMLKKTKKNKWGPVPAKRQSERIGKDTRPALQKAEDLLAQKNLEKPAQAKGKNKNSTGLQHSFASVENEILLKQANSIHINLGASSSEIQDNINQIKNVETNRINCLQDTQPEIFLPSDIDCTLDDLLETKENEETEYDSSNSLEGMGSENEEIKDSVESEAQGIRHESDEMLDSSNYKRKCPYGIHHDER